MKHLTEVQLNEYLDEILDESILQEVQDHLADCGQCRGQLDDLKTLFLSLEDLSEMPLARDLTLGVLAGLPKDSRIPVLWEQPAFVLQSLLAIILLVISMPWLRVWGREVSKWFDGSILPEIRTPVFSEMIAQLRTFLALKSMRTFEIPEIQRFLTDFGSKQEFNILLLLIIFSGLLWMIGNFSLLRSRSETME